MTRIRMTMSALMLSWLMLGTTACSGKAESNADQSKQSEATQDDASAVIEALNQPSEGEPQKTVSANAGTKIIYLTAAEFKQLVFDYEKNTEWKYEGQLPAIVDFYADWCKPCKMIAPILEELQEEYKGKLQVYKVNVDKEQELAQVFQTQSIPSLLFIPMQGQPQMAKGALPKESFQQAVTDVLKVTK